MGRTGIGRWKGIRRGDIALGWSVLWYGRGYGAEMVPVEMTPAWQLEIVRDSLGLARHVFIFGLQLDDERFLTEFAGCHFLRICWSGGNSCAV